MTTLRFRLSERAQPLGTWLAELLPDLDRAARRRLVEAGGVRLDGRPFDHLKRDCPPGSDVEVDLGERPLEGDPFPTGSSETWFALVVAAPWPSGSIEIEGGRCVEFRAVAQQDEWQWLRLHGAESSAASVCRGLARAGSAVAGDLQQGGVALAGGPWIRTPASLGFSQGQGTADFLEEGVLPWPDEGPWPADAATSAEDASFPTLQVSREAARAVAGGHPWILPDEASDSARRLRPGSLVRVVERGDRPVAWARIEGSSRLSARVWGDASLAPRALPSVDARVARALARRKSLYVEVASSGTNTHRLIHGEGDDLPGLYVDRVGPLLRFLVSGWSALDLRASVLAAIRAQWPVTPEGQDWSVLELLHLRAPGATQVDRVSWQVGGLEALREAGVDFWRGESSAPDLVAEGFWVEERGLRYAVDPGWDSPRRTRPGFGLFADQRENRTRVAEITGAGGRWLNLFAHTGAFSVALLAAGAERVVSVDLSAPYLTRLEENLRANVDRGVDPGQHETIRGDVRGYLEGLAPAETFQGIVVDPPTAAAAGRRFWSVKQDLEPLLESALARLADGGTLLVTQNRSGPALGVDLILEKLAVKAGRRVEAVRPASAGEDHPSLPKFPEGDPFEGWLVTLR